jgi:hypothetical protein
MSISQDFYVLGAVEIAGPSVSEKRCSIFIDLADLFNTQLTSEAVDIVKRRWKESSNKGKLDIDTEADYVSITTSRNAIIDLALLINEIAGINDISQEDIEQAKKIIKIWQQPAPALWKTGDIFSFKLKNGHYGYGQVLNKTEQNVPTCLLFSYQSNTEAENIQEVIESTAISILHVQENHLNEGKWKIVGNTNPLLPADAGPCGARGAIGSRQWDGLEILANAWHGLEPWNAFYKEDYLDEYLLSGVTRPKNLMLLNRRELESLGVKRREWLS